LNGPQNPFADFNDFRLNNLNDQLYLSTKNRIAPLYLNIDLLSESRKIDRNADPNTNNTTTQYVFIPSIIQEENGDTGSNLLPSLASSSSSRSLSTSFSVYMRSYTSCGVYGVGKRPSVQGKKSFKQYYSSKNLLYFVDDENGENKNLVDGNRTAENPSMSCKMLHYPRWNPNDVRDVQLDVPCGMQRITPYDYAKMEESKSEPPTSFRNVDELYYPLDGRRAAMFMSDRGSACCVSLMNPNTGQRVLVGITHPKTPYPGKKLPEDVQKNTYLSRFFAFEPHSPYDIVQRSGMFCLGYPNNRTNDGGDGDSYPSKAYKIGSLQFAGETHDCPRIHFILGMVDKVDDESKVILSYGVSDCLSRFVEVNKAEIAQLLWTGPTTV
jgi:hypothetical protein